MKHPTKLAIWLGAILGTCCALLLNVHGQVSYRSGQLTEEFHRVYPLSAKGRPELDNINGAMHITAWDRDEVKVKCGEICQGERAIGRSQDCR